MRSFWPHLSMALNAALMVVVILNIYNPLLGLLRGAPFLVLLGASFASSSATAVTLIAAQRRGKHEGQN